MREHSIIFIYSCVLTVLTLSSVSLLWKNPLWLTLILVIISIVTIGIGKTREDIYLYIVGFFLGSLFEAIAIAFGAWAYSLPDILGIPFWLPLVWGNATVFTKRIYLEIHYFLSKNRS